MKKTFKAYLGVWAILLVTFNVLAFALFGFENTAKFTGGFWAGYGFITAALVGQLICAKIFFNEKSNEKTFYTLPLVTLSWIGLIITFMVGSLCMVVPMIPYWVGIVVSMLVLAITAIAVINASVAAESVEKIDTKIKTQTFFIKSLTVDAEGLIARATTDEIKAECKKVFEAIRYSDPMSSDALSACESQISIRFAGLSDAVKENDVEAVKSFAKEVLILLDERNKKCKLFK